MAVPVFSRPAQSRERSPGPPRRPVHRLNSSAGQSGALVKRRSRVRIPLQARGTSHETSSGLGSPNGSRPCRDAWAGMEVAILRRRCSVIRRPPMRGWRPVPGGQGAVLNMSRPGWFDSTIGNEPADGFSFNDTVPPGASRPGGTPAPVAQRTERRFPKAGVAGSSPAMGTMPC